MSDHLSEDQMCRAIAGQSTIDELRHVSSCAACREEIEASRSTLSAFRTVVTDIADRSARRSAKQVGAPAGSRAWYQVVPAAALTTVLAALVWQIAGSPRPAGVEPGRSARSSGASVGASSRTADGGEFFPLRYSNVPVSDVRIIRLEVPRTALAAFGVDPRDATSARPDAVLADVLVGEDGLARAVRFVHPRGESWSASRW